MKTLPCDIVRDLLPLYVDDVVHDTTRLAIKQHLQTCDACRMEAERMNAHMELPINENVQHAEAQILNNLKKHLFRKKVIVSIFSIAIAILVLFSVYSYMALTEVAIPYDAHNMTISEQDGQLYIRYHYDDAACDGSVAFDPAVITIDGQEQMVVGVYYYETLWSKYVAPYLPIGEKSATELAFCLGYFDEIDQVYYGGFDLKNGHFDYATAIGDMNLIWEKNAS